MPVRQSPAADLLARREALRATEFFRVLTQDEQEAVLTRSLTQRFPRNAVIFRRGDQGSGMLVVLQGRVRISVLSPEGQEVSLGVLGPGEVVGEMALLDGGTRSADVCAVDECVVLTIQRSHFLPLLQGNANLCLRLIEVLCARLRRSNLSVEEIATLDLSARLGRLLLRLGQNFGTRVGGGFRIDLKLSQKDLSTLIAGSREKVNRQLRLWEQDGVVATENGYLVIRRPDALADASP